ncbi:MAG: ATP-binding cassette domain-containing protein [Marinilabiliaceae bacterium]|nr:ATP-binding cassette domain-containing protein [Marinilabiliaceae bacterium]
MADIIYSHVEARNPELQLDIDNDIRISRFKSLAILGPNGSGKSRFTDSITKHIAINSGTLEFTINGSKINNNEIGYVSFKDVNKLTDSLDSYYQKRWNATENEDCSIVADIIGRNRIESVIDTIRLFGIENILEKHIIQISSGELRKLLIVLCLLKKPKLIVIDNPYIGLDAASREIVNEMLHNICDKSDIVLIINICNNKDLPDWIDRVVLLKELKCVGVCNTKDYLSNEKLQSYVFYKNKKNIKLPDTYYSSDISYKNAVIMNSISVSYYNKTILDNINWIIKKQETWALLGENGCGKSTLLSLVSGDNPKSYANDIVLFDRRRGTGESIWDIKKHIGYLTPDMHTYYRENISCLDVVATGFHDTVGLFIKPTDEERRIAKLWMHTFKADNLAERSFLKISYGEQRLILLCRVFVKTPDLLILDEPLHGLDQSKKQLVKAIIEKYCDKLKPTLIYVTHYENEIPDVVRHYKRLTKI